MTIRLDDWEKEYIKTSIILDLEDTRPRDIDDFKDWFNSMVKLLKKVK